MDPCAGLHILAHGSIPLPYLPNLCAVLRPAPLASYYFPFLSFPLLSPCIGLSLGRRLISAEWRATIIIQGIMLCNPSAERGYWLILCHITMHPANNKARASRTMQGLSRYLETGCPNRGFIYFCVSKVWYKIHTTNKIDPIPLQILLF